MRAGSPLLSVVVVVKNGLPLLERCLRSLEQQSFDDFEVVLIDGCSNDGSVEVEKQYSRLLTHHLVEPDEGIYDAMNKGAALSRGQFVGFLNADECLENDALSRIADVLGKTSGLAFTVGTILIEDEHGNPIAERRLFPNLHRSWRRFFRMPGCHMTIYASREAWDCLGGFDGRFPIRADHELVLRMMKGGYNECPVSGPLGRYRLGGASDGISRLEETARLSDHYKAPRWIKAVAYGRYWLHRLAVR
jgi:glycosyltransferase involved in cell wall biosynthesis